LRGQRSHTCSLVSDPGSKSTREAVPQALQHVSAVHSASWPTSYCNVLSTETCRTSVSGTQHDPCWPATAERASEILSVSGPLLRRRLDRRAYRPDPWSDPDSPSAADRGPLAPDGIGTTPRRPARPGDAHRSHCTARRSCRRSFEPGRRRTPFRTGREMAPGTDTIESLRRHGEQVAVSRGPTRPQRIRRRTGPIPW